jgi:hypothetical protein
MPSTNIDFSLPDASHVDVAVFDVAGRRVATLAEGRFEAGVHTVRWDARNAAAGVYFCRFQAGGDVATQRMVRLE